MTSYVSSAITSLLLMLQRSPFASAKLCVAKILCALKMARFPAARLSHPGPSPSSAENLSQEHPSGIPGYISGYIRTEESGRFRDATFVRIRRPDRTGGAALPVAHEKGRDLRLWRKNSHPGDHDGNSLPNALRLHSAKDFRTRCGQDSRSGIEPLRALPVHTWHPDQR